MATAEYPVTTTYSTVFQQGQGQPAVGLLNPGTSVIYLDTSPQLSTTQGMPLNPNATYKWAAGTALYVIAPASGGVCRVLWDQDVQYYDPASLAAAINLIGVPSIDVPTTLFNGTQTVPTGATPTATGNIDVSRYTSIFARFQDTSPTNNVTTRNYTFSWYGDAARTILLGVDTFQMATYGGSGFITRPAKGAFLEVTATSAATVTPSTLLWTIAGSYRSVPPRLTLKSAKNNTSGQLSPASDVNKGLWVIDANLAPGTLTEYPDLVTGQVTLFCRSISAGASELALDLTTWSGVTLFAQEIQRGGLNAFSFTIFIPPEPLIVTLNNFAAGALDFLVQMTSGAVSNS